MTTIEALGLAIRACEREKQSLEEHQERAAGQIVLWLRYRAEIKKTDAAIGYLSALRHRLTVAGRGNRPRKLSLV